MKLLLVVILAFLTGCTNHPWSGYDNEPSHPCDTVRANTTHQHFTQIKQKDQIVARHMQGGWEFFSFERIHDDEAYRGDHGDGFVITFYCRGV